MIESFDSMSTKEDNNYTPIRDQGCVMTTKDLILNFGNLLDRSEEKGLDLAVDAHIN